MHIRTGKIEGYAISQSLIGNMLSSNNWISSITLGSEKLTLTTGEDLMNYGIALLLALALSGCTTTSRESQLQTALSLTKEHFKNTAMVKDDSLDTIATISTVNGFQEKRGLLGIVWEDNFLRAFIDKKTGKTSFQLYQVINYQGGGWNFYQTVNFETTSGPQSTPVTVISRDVDCTGSRYGGAHMLNMLPST